MASRLKLHEELSKIPGIKKVYFNPPESVKMTYPCIRYERMPPDLKRADDRIYRNTDRYRITVIDTNPASEIYKYILENFRMCSFDRTYKADNLNHDDLSLFY